MNTLTTQELKTMFHSCGLTVIHLDQGQVPRYKDQHPVVTELIVKDLESNGRPAMLSAMRRKLKSLKRKTRRATQDAFTYGGSIFNDPDGKPVLVMSVAIAQRPESEQTGR